MNKMIFVITIILLSNTSFAKQPYSYTTYTIGNTTYTTGVNKEGERFKKITQHFGNTSFTTKETRPKPKYRTKKN